MGNHCLIDGAGFNIIYGIYIEKGGDQPLTKDD